MVDRYEMEPGKRYEIQYREFADRPIRTFSAKFIEYGDDGLTAQIVDDDEGAVGRLALEYIIEVNELA